MIVKNIIIDGELKFIHIYYSDEDELEGLLNKFDGFIYELHKFKRGNIISLSMSYIDGDKNRNHYLLKINEKEKDINKSRKIEKDIFNSVIILAKGKGIGRKWSNPEFKNMYHDYIEKKLISHIDDYKVDMEDTGQEETHKYNPKYDPELGFVELDLPDNIDEDIVDYFNKLDSSISEIFKRPTKELNINDLDILDDNSSETIEIMKIELKRKQHTMKYGEVWQKAIGLFPGFEDLGIGHESECDVRKLDNTMIIELKNKYNTVNSGGKKDVERKLINYKVINPHTDCVWGIVNDKHTNKVKKEKYVVNGLEIIKWQGKEFLSHIFTYNGYDYTDKILSKLKEIIHRKSS